MIEICIADLADLAVIAEALALFEGPVLVSLVVGIQRGFSDRNAPLTQQIASGHARLDLSLPA